MNENKEISSLSYVDKDFGAIYPEMLDLAKQLTNKWDPSQSNESDPGVVLIKEGAFVADHNNYNIDKNILEAFLPSATQDRSVRNITEMNGYTPRYYVSANGDVTFTWTQPEDAETSDVFSVPAFTFVISDVDETVSYTQVEDLVISGSGTPSSCRFIEGTLQTLTINDNSVISLENLDDDNRLYLPETMVAQNGIYIRNYITSSSADDDNSLWERNNYLLTQPLGSKIYKIDYDSLKLLPYIEFPSDIANLIGDGLQIQYIATSGVQGNVSSNTLTKILSPSSFYDLSAEPKERLSENLTVNNYSAITNGKDPETIAEMYQSFRKVVGTFDTLVTCKDYENKIYMLTDGIDNPLVSNAYVTDRRTDYNKSAQIVSWDVDSSLKRIKIISTNKCALEFKGKVNDITEVASASPGDMYYVDDDGLYVNMSTNSNKIRFEKQSSINLNDFALLTQAMTPYDLVMYAFKAFSMSDYNPDRYWLAYNNSFKPVSSAIREEIKMDLETYKCISHTWNDPSGNDIYCFKNYAPLNVLITPSKKVTKVQRDEIVDNIRRALSERFNPRNINFGEKLDVEELEDTIVNCDSRIRRVDILPIEYTTKVMYSQEGREEDSLNTTLLLSLIAKNVLAGRLCMFDFNDDFSYEYGQENGKTYNNEKQVKTELYIPLKTVDASESASEDSARISSTRFKSTGQNYKYTFTPVGNTEEIFNNLDYEMQIGDVFILYEIDPLTNREIKSTSFKSTTDSKMFISNKLDNDASILSGTKIDLPAGDVMLKKQVSTRSLQADKVNLEYTLKKNEAIQIIYPNYYSDTTYSVYVYYRYEVDGDDIDLSTYSIKANTDHTLEANERIILKYSKNGSVITNILQPGEVVYSTFDLIPTEIASTSGIKKDWDDSFNGKGFKQLGTNQSISKRKLMMTKLDSTGIKCYWIVPANANGNMVLFEGNETSRILNKNEYFIYANSSLTELVILGSGTKLERQNASNNEQWSIPKNTLTIESISNVGLQKSDLWRDIDFTNNNLFITEMNVITLGESDKIKIWGWTKEKMPRTVVGSTTTYAFNINGYNYSSEEQVEDGFSICDGNIEYTINGTSNILAAVNNFYNIKSRLDLNMGPKVEQQLITTKEGNNIVSSQRIILKYDNGSTVVDDVISADDVDNRYIQASKNVVAIGNVSELLEDTNFFAYSKDGVKYNKGIKLTDTSRTEASFEFFCDDIEKIHMIPVHMTGSEQSVTAKFYLNTAPDTYQQIQIEDYNSSEVDDQLIMYGNTSYYLVPKKGSISVGKDVKLKLTFEWDAPAENENELLLLEDIVIINGINKDLEDVIPGSDPLGSLESEISTIIAGSDHPSIKPYYPYRVDNSIAMNTVDFKNAYSMWDKNNIANKMTIAQIDLQNSVIDISNDMKDGDY